MRSRRYWLNLAKFGLGLSLIAALVLVVWVLGLTVHYTRATIYPPRSAAGQPVLPLQSDFPHQAVQFESSDGLTLHGWYFPPQNGIVIILGHGHAGNEGQLDPEANLLAAEGYGVLLFAWRGNGASQGNKVTFGDTERRDLRAALDFVQAQPQVEHIGAYGFSMGAVVVALVAAEDPRIEAVILAAPYHDLEAMTRHQAGLLGPLSEETVLWTLRREGIDVAAVSPVQSICQISPRPLLLIFGEKDQVPPPDSAEKLYQAACDPKELWIIPQAEHGEYLRVAPEAYPARLIAFFNAAFGLE